MPIITLTTDFGLKDHFVGAIKGAIYSELPDAKIVDISHLISPFNIAETAYIINNSYKTFPEGSIHIIGVDSELNIDNKHIALLLDGYYFICPDNGIISMIASKIKPEKIVEINIHNQVPSSFPSFNIFVKVACHLARGGKLEVIGKPLDNYKKITELQPLINKEKNLITGCVIYIDNYGNVITNITKKTFDNIVADRPFEIHIKRYILNKIYTEYCGVVDFSIPKEKRRDEGKKLAIFNAAGFLEIAIYKSNLQTVGGASTLLGITYRDRVTVTFTNH